MQQIRLNAHPHEGQRAVHANPARFKVLSAGRRWGKTRLGVLECFDVATRGGRAWWVAPTYKVSEVGWRPIKRLAPRTGGELRRVDRQAVWPNGGEITVRSADEPDSLRGDGLDLVVIDEAAHLRKFDEVWAQALRPALSDRQGKAMFISTPKGHNHFYNLFQSAETSDGWAAFQFPTGANPYIAKDEIAAAERQLPELVFRQEYGAEFVQLAGAIVKREWFEVVDAVPDGLRTVAFCDLAASTKTSADYTVIAVLGMAEDATLYVLDVVRGRWEWPDARVIIADAALAHDGLHRLGVEKVAFQLAAVQDLQRDARLVGVAVEGVGVDRDKLSRALPWFARAKEQRVKLLRGAWNAAWLDEVCAFPEAEHDDQVDAVSGAVQMLAHGDLLLFTV